MEILHAPWRARYLEDDSERSPTVFSDIIQSGDDEANRVLVRRKTCLAVLNKFPYSTGHTLVVPYKCTACYEELAPAELGELMGLSQEIVRILRAEFRAEAFNVGFNLGTAAGAGIADHIHLHVVPRWSGDHNFMTVLAATRVHPGELETVWRRMRAHFSG
ncbi:MAG TPA: HIT domain-containing protein [Verrucomicrobiae bacterium]|nr:HIT domain-containing protein [Verrucomicrobiae bacterium]